MSNPLARTRRRRRAPIVEALEDRRLLASHVPGDVMTISEGASPGEGSFGAVLVGDDRLVVAWEEDVGGGTGLDVYARWYGVGGAPIGDAFRLNVDAAGDQASPRVELSPDGEIVFAWWSEEGLETRRYEPDGAAVGGPVALAGSAGLSRDFELFGATADGLSILDDGFRARRYGLDGSETASMTLAPAEPHWEAVESDARDRAAYQDGTTLLTWSEVRFGARPPFLDSRVMMGYFGPDGSLISKYVVKLYTTRLHGFAEDLDPRLLESSSRIAWRGDLPDDAPWMENPTTRWFETSSYAFGSEPVYIARYDEDVPAEQADGVPTAIDADFLAYVHYVRPGSPGGVESYFRVWTPQFLPIPSPAGGYRYWRPGEPIPTPELAPGTFDAVQILPTGGGDVWLLWNGPEGGLNAQRFFDATPIVTSPDGPATVGEADGRTTIRLARNGDLSRPLTLRYKTSSTDALPGYDFVRADGTVTFEAGRSEATISVDILDDDAADGDKTFTVEAWDPTEAAAIGVLLFDVTVLDDEPEALRPLSFFDYGAAGLWSFNEVAGWTKLNDVAPRSMLATPGGTLYADYGGAGLWSWDAVRDWRKLNDAAPEAMAHGTGRLVLDYGSQGLWSLGEFDGWAQLSPADPRKVVGDDSAILVDFGPNGVWSWDDARGYLRIGPDSPEGMTFLVNDFYFDYGANGLWRFHPAYPSGQWEWERLSPADPTSIAVEPDRGALYVDFGPDGLWRWDRVDGFQRLDATPAARFAIGPNDSGTHAAYVDYGAAGLWFWDWPTGAVKLNDASALAIATGSGDDVILDFGGNGVWRWSPTAGWRRINEGSPRAIART
ncbi:Calx-beta domain-containing protein [Paludisphaera sp.]|uniref:Calx-beta domain-containing protein n=1 Tax=Paludisphaera sp. TaxID=2017432 RepID=UPI00301CB6C9